VFCDAPLDAARKLAPQIRAAADEAEALRELPKPLFESIFDAGLIHLAIPRRVGGTEIDLPTYVQVIEELGKADASTGWVVNQLTIYGTYASRMPTEIAREIWMDTPRGCVANTPAATAKAIVVPGGYRVTGRQGFSTGSRHAAWVAAHCQVIENGQVRLENGEPETRYLFVPVAEAQLLDTWKVRGMRATGTHHFAVNDVFVPAHRTVLSATARSCLTAFMELAGSKTPRSTPGLLREQSMTQVTVGQAEAALRTSRAFLMEAVREIWSAALNDAVTLDERANLRLATTHGIRTAAQIVDSLYNASGATSAYEDNLIQRHFQDAHVMTQHLQGRPAHYELVGRYWLGLSIDQARL
jgi:alkylation response protein AidB-like acyl-CoA dehydrogenase